MTTDTATARLLPIDMATLRANYLPAPPDDTAVTAALAAVARIDALVGVAVVQLEQLDQADRDVATQIADAALADGPLEPVVARLKPGARAVHVYRLERLRAARWVAADRHARAERTDEQHLAWQAECKAIIDDWQACLWAEEPADRFRLLSAFVATH